MDGEALVQCSLDGFHVRSQPKFWQKMKKIGGDWSPRSPAFRMYDYMIMVR